MPVSRLKGASEMSGERPGSMLRISSPEMGMSGPQSSRDQGRDREPLHCTQEATKDDENCYGDNADILVGGDVRRRGCPSAHKQWTIPIKAVSSS